MSSPEPEVMIGWWSPGGSGRRRVLARDAQEVRRELLARGCVVWREGLQAADQRP